MAARKSTPKAPLASETTKHFDRKIEEIPKPENPTVKKNIERFPAVFALSLTIKEWENLRCQIGISSAPARASAGAGPNSSQSVMYRSKPRIGFL